MLGGITRLTGSGLSITEWKPIMGAFPPMNDKEWNEAFNGYKQIGQYKLQNNYFTLSDFKFIFFWEWFHRVWARALGVVFIIGFVYFLVRKYFDKEMIVPFVILFLLGGLQGLVGWLMVASGLDDSHLAVDHIYLATHFISAMLLACYTLWFALQLLIPTEKRVRNNKLHNFVIILIVLLSVQLVYGAFMAGLKAAMSAATWPTINGMWIPENMMQHSFISDKLSVHFVHRGLAYIIFILVIFWFATAIRYAKKHGSTLLQRSSIWPLILVSLQVVLGIVTVISAPTIVFGKFGQFQSLALLHQLVAMFLLMSLVTNLYIVRKKAA